MSAKMLSSFRFAATLCIFLILFVGPSAAQVTTATISGRVADESASALPKARVTITNLATRAARTVETDEEGRYEAPGLALGTYEVNAEVSSFQSSMRTGIELTVGRHAVVDLVLKVGAVTEKIVVQGDVTAVDASGSTLSGLVDQNQMRALPLNARSYVQLATLETGVQQFRGVGAPTTTFAGSGRGIRIAMNGSRPAFNNYLLDGVDSGDAFNNAPGGAAGVFLGVETLREFQVLENTYSAEYGRVGGGIINAVTRSGDNQFHGTAFEFLRNDKLDARNFFDGSKIPPFRRNQFGGLVSGPILRNQTFFLISYEGLRERLGQTIVSISPDQNARNGILPGRAPITVSPTIRPYLGLYPLPNGRNFGNGTGEFVFPFTQRTREDFATVRIDHRFSDRDSIFARYTIEDGEVLRVNTFPQFGVDDTSRSQNFTIQEQRIFPRRLLNMFRFGFNRSRFQSLDIELAPVDPNLSFVPGQGFGLLLVEGLSPMGITKFGPIVAPFLNLFDVADDVLYTRGAHLLKFGFDIKRFQVNATINSFNNGVWNFFSLPNFLQDQPFAFLSLRPGSDVTRGYRQWLFGFYTQDDYKLLSNLTLNLGIRYEFVTVPTEEGGRIANLRNPFTDAKPFVGGDFVDNPSLKNFAPRIGFAWDPLGSRKTSVRGGFGIFYNQVGFGEFFRSLMFTPPFSGIGALPSSLPFVTFPRIAPQLFPANIVFPTQFNLNTPTIFQYNFNVQREIFRNTLLTVGYVGSHGTHLPRNTEIDTFQFQVANGQKIFPIPAPPPAPPPPRVNPNFVGVDVVDTRGNSSYNSLQIVVRRRFSGGLQFQVSYTYAHSIDDAPPLLRDVDSNPSIVLDALDGRRDRGNSDFDIRQNLVFNYSYVFPFASNTTGLRGKILRGWEMDGITTIQDGTPFTVENAFDRASTGKIGPFLTDRPDAAPGASTNPVLGGPDKYFDPSAFVLQPAGQYGNLGRNTLIGPGLVNFDFSLIKNTRVGEKLTVQFRTEFFNIFNRTNLAAPTGVGRIAFLGTVPAPGAPGIPNPAAGRITKTVTPSRQIQFGLKLIF